MSVIDVNSLISPFWLPNGHFQSIYPALFRKVKGVKYFREKIVTPDEDFLNLDWSGANSNRSDTLVILTHGLEGDSSRQYMLGLIKLLNKNGLDCLGWNFRSCGGEMNNALRFYHSGATDDLDLVVQHALLSGYENIYLAGFSLGGNLTLKYLGEYAAQLDSRIKKALVFSVPMDLKACSLAIIKPENRVYMQRFLNTLSPKVAAKAALYPDHISISDYKHVKTLYDFDHIYTAPLHGFKGADDYYAQCSSMHFLKNIRVLTQIINAKNDPIVPFASLPLDELRIHNHVSLIASSEGGHCGFRPARLVDEFYWSEKRALEFFLAENG
ncbi:YheT family hydrolase [Dyadobacter sp. Leaf189]|uniref:YheT family hydrolase n=1 Tax=Dyadobacter sp. Leaf189 TaxID=1736295 RepID=UPI0006F5CAA4|nr:alpha/beta fold hydrolase [Dyadobacter sp. Leaf189]KQS33355.1 alpha/beta hydrolase [Dyadobacter sp. Leaf189]